MPKKGHKAAARQAKLSQKKRRGKGSPEIFASGPVKSNVSVDDVDPQTQPTTLAVAEASIFPVDCFVSMTSFLLLSSVSFVLGLKESGASTIAFLARSF